MAPVVIRYDIEIHLNNYQYLPKLDEIYFALQNRNGSELFQALFAPNGPPRRGIYLRTVGLDRNDGN
jgi:hypothetical protein